MTEEFGPAERARATVVLLGVDPHGLGGLWLRTRAGPIREAFVAALKGALAPIGWRKIAVGTADSVLFGGVDVASTLASGRIVTARGIVGDRAQALVLPMAERVRPEMAARLAMAAGGGQCVVALDEGIEPDEALPSALADRLALHLDLDGVSHGELDTNEAETGGIVVARRRLDGVSAGTEDIAELTVLSARLGIDSLRAPYLALRCARAAAALAGRDEVAAPDLMVAAALVLGPRARHLPEADEASDAPPPPDPSEDSPPPEEGTGGKIPEEILTRAIQTALPPDMLARLRDGRSAPGSAGQAGSGARRKGNRRGRPLAAQRPRRGDGARIDVIATLREAVPWQALRRSQAKAHDRLIHFRPEDLRVRRFEERSDRLLVFVVDASGSAAMARLAEAKGAVEILLGEAYARRDQVAVIAFRAKGADLLLPPTRSLVQARHRLAALPGGGGTPLAHGLRTALAQCEAARGRGLSPGVALLTDGRANIALDGSADRAAADADAQKLARLLRAHGYPALVLDCGARPQAKLRDLAVSMAADYMALPRADPRRISGAVESALATRL